MIKIYRIIFVLFLFLFGLQACKQPPKSNYPAFNYKSFRIEKISGYQLKHLDSLVQGIDICVIHQKNILIVLDIQDKDFLKVYDLANFKYLKSFIPKGPGLNQQLSCRSIQYMDGFLYASDTHKKKIFIYNVDDISKPKSKVLPVDEININGKSFFRPLLLPNDLELQFHQIAHDRKMFIFDYFDRSGNLMYSKGDYPILENKIEFNNLNYAYLAGMNLSGDHKNILVDYYNTDILELYDIKGNLKKRVQGPDQIFPKIRSEVLYGGSISYLSPDSHRAYTGKVRSLNGSLYVLYNGKIATDHDIHVNRLFSFSSTLEPQNYYQLPVPIYALDVDEKSSHIYGLSTKLNKVNLIVFNLK